MSNTVPTPITDKNGKKTTVHKKAQSKTNTRAASAGAPPRVTDTSTRWGEEDPIDSIQRGIRSLASIIEHKDLNNVARISSKINAMAESAIFLEGVSSVPTMSNSIVEGSFRAYIEMGIRNSDNAGAIEGYKLALSHFDVAVKLHDDTLGDNAPLVRGNFNISDLDKTKIAALYNIGQVAEQRLGVSDLSQTGTATVVASEVYGASNYLLNLTGMKTRKEDVDALVRDFLPELGNDLDSLARSTDAVDVRLGDLRQYLTELLVVSRDGV